MRKEENLRERFAASENAKEQRVNGEFEGLCYVMALYLKWWLWNC